jgi:hypothetical protein
MNRVLVALPIVAVLVAAAWPSTRGAQAASPGVCAQMTMAKLLESPVLAEAYARALRTGDADEIARVRAMFEQIRSVHGCGEAGRQDAERQDAAPAPRLPPGHPPIAPGERPAGSVQFEDPGAVTI